MKERKFKLVYRDRGSYSDDDTGHKGWWTIYEKRWWGWKRHEESCWGLESAKACVQRIKDNPTVYL